MVHQHQKLRFAASLSTLGVALLGLALFTVMGGRSSPPLEDPTENGFTDNEHYSCARLDSGMVKCWERTDTTQLGYSYKATDRTDTKKLPDPSPGVAIASNGASVNVIATLESK